MDEEARRAIEDQLDEHHDHELFPLLRRTLLALAGVVDRHHDESGQEHSETRRRLSSVNRLAFSVGTGVILALIAAIINVWLR